MQITHVVRGEVSNLWRWLQQLSLCKGMASIIVSPFGSLRRFRFPSPYLRAFASSLEPRWLENVQTSRRCASAGLHNEVKLYFTF